MRTNVESLIARIAGALCIVAGSVLVHPVPTSATAVVRAPAASEASGHAGRAGPVDFVVESISPHAPGPDDTLRISGRITATGRAFENVSVRLRFSASAFTSRSVMDFYARGGTSDRFDTDPLYDTSKRVTQRLAAGASASFSLQVPVEKLRLDDFGVYPLAVEVLGGGSTLARQRTFLPFVPNDSQVAPTRVAWMWPIIDRPHRAVDSAFTDNRLASALSPDGRLGRLVAAAAEKSGSQMGGGDIPLLWAIDPALLRAARDMTDGYEVRKLSSNEVTEYEDGTVAEEWLNQLREAVGDQTVFSVPFADPDVMALHRAGLDDTLSLAITGGPQITEDILDRPVTPDVVWPVGGWLDQDTLDTLAGVGTETVILNERSLPPERPITYTPNAVTATHTVGGKIDVLIADSTLTRILGNPTRAPGSAVLTQQRFLAETALITDERPYEKGTLLLTPPRRWSPPPGFAAEILAESAEAPWLRPADLSYLREHPSEVKRAGLRYPPEARAEELSQQYLAEVEEIYADLGHFTSILDTRTSVFDYALLRAESSAWRARPKAARRLRDAVHEQLTTKMSKVRIIAKKPIVLASNAATVPITIANGLTDTDLAVTVGLEITARNSARLDVGKIPDQVRVLPDHRKTLEVRLEAMTPGVVDVTMQLKTPDGEDYGKPVQVDVRATGYGTAAKGITVGALAVIVLALGVRLIRRTLRPGRPDDAAETDDSTEDAEEKT